MARCAIKGHEHELVPLPPQEGCRMFECPTTGSRWIEVPKGTKASSRDSFGLGAHKGRADKAAQEVWE